MPWRPEPLEQRVGAEAAVAQANAVFGRQVGGHQSGVVAFHGKVHDADRAGVRLIASSGRSGGRIGSRIGKDPVHGYPFDALEALDEEGPDGVLVGLPLLRVQGCNDLGGAGEGCRTEDVRRAALVPGRSRGPADGVEPGIADRAAAGQVRGTGVEPVRPPHQHAGAERGVQLVPREGEVIDVVRGDIDPPVRGELRGVDNDPGAVFVRQCGQGPDREDLPGDVGGASDGQQADAAAGEFVAQPVHGGREGGGGHDAAVRDILPGQEVGVVFDVEVEDLARGPPVAQRQAAGQQVQGIGGVAREDHGIAGPAAHEVPHDVPSVLVDGGADLRCVAGATVHACVVRQDFVQVGRDHGQGRGRGAVVEVGVARVAAGDQRGLDLGPGDGCQRAGREGKPCMEFRGNGENGSCHGTSLEQDPTPWESALAGSVPDRPGRHPGHPTATGGLPASKPGFSAGTRDLHRA